MQETVRVKDAIYDVDYIGSGRNSTAYRYIYNPDIVIVCTYRCTLKDYYAQVSSSHWLIPKVNVIAEDKEDTCYSMPYYKTLDHYSSFEMGLATHRYFTIRNFVYSIARNVGEFLDYYYENEPTVLPEIKEELEALLIMAKSLQFHPGFKTLQFDLHDGNFAPTTGEHLIVLDPIVDWNA